MGLGSVGLAMENKARRIRPNVAVIIFGIAIALFTVVSGVVQGGSP